MSFAMTNGRIRRDARGMGKAAEAGRAMTDTNEGRAVRGALHDIMILIDDDGVLMSSSRLCCCSLAQLIRSKLILLRSTLPERSPPPTVDIVISTASTIDNFVFPFDIAFLVASISPFVYESNHIEVDAIIAAPITTSHLFTRFRRINDIAISCLIVSYHSSTQCRLVSRALLLLVYFAAYYAYVMHHRIYQCRLRAIRECVATL